MTMKAFETTATVKKDNQLLLDSPVPYRGKGKVRLIILLPDEDVIDESEWLGAASTNPVFDFLKDPETLTREHTNTRTPVDLLQPLFQNRSPGAIGPHRHVVLAFITSQIPDEQLDSDIVIDSSDQDFNTIGLRVSSTLRLHRLMTVTTSLIKRELGKLSSKLQSEIDKKLRTLFEL